MPRLLPALALAAALCPPAAAQNGIWSYNVSASLLDDSPYSMATNGDLLAHGMRLAPDGQVVWRRTFREPGEVPPTTLWSATSVGSELLALARVVFGVEYRTCVMRLAQNGSVLWHTRLQDPSASAQPARPGDRIVIAPDQGWLVLRDNVYRFNYDGSLRWARSYEEFERPRSVAWAPDGGFYAVGNGAGILRYAADGTPLRRMTTLGDSYDGALATTVKYAPVLHNDRLYLGISTLVLDNGQFRNNCGVLVMDTAGTLLGSLMNEELRSPADDSSLGALVTLAVVGDRLVVAMSQSSNNVGGRTHLLDCDLELGDARWYSLPEGADHQLHAVFAAPDGRALLAGVYDGDLMQLRLQPGDDHGNCFTPRSYTPAPLVLTGLVSTPAAAPAAPATLGIMGLESSVESAPAATFRCNFVGVPEQAAAPWHLAPNPATDRLLLRTDEAPLQGTLHLLDAAGRRVLSAPVNSPQVELAVGHLPAGLYAVQLSTTAGSRVIGRVAVAGR